MENMKPLVIIIEDESPLLDAITKRIKEKEIETISCTTGEQALDYISAIDQLPDQIYIWLDYYLSGEMNGLAFIKEVKKKYKSKDIKVVIVSNSASDQTIHNALILGAEKYMVKAEHRLDDLIEQFIGVINSSQIKHD